MSQKIKDEISLKNNKLYLLNLQKNKFVDTLRKLFSKPKWLPGLIRILISYLLFIVRELYKSSHTLSLLNLKTASDTFTYTEKRVIPLLYSIVDKTLSRFPHGSG